MASASAAFVDNHDVVFIRVAPTHDQVDKFGRGFSGAAGHVENRTLIGMRVTRGNKDDFQRQFASLSCLSILENFVDSAAKLLPNPLDVTRFQDDAGADRTSGRRYRRRERRPQRCG